MVSIYFGSIFSNFSNASSNSSPKVVWSTNKNGVDGKVERYKERLVVKGYFQIKGIDFHEIFSLVVEFVSICIVLILVVLLDLGLVQ